MSPRSRSIFKQCVRVAVEMDGGKGVFSTLTFIAVVSSEFDLSEHWSCRRSTFEWAVHALQQKTYLRKIDNWSWEVARKSHAFLP